MVSSPGSVNCSLKENRHLALRVMVHTGNPSTWEDDAIPPWEDLKFKASLKFIVRLSKKTKAELWPSGRGFVLQAQFLPPVLPKYD